MENMVSRVTYANGGTLHYGYDKAGNLVRETNADGGITRYEYDLLGQLTGIKSADGTVTEYEYNKDGEVVSEFVRTVAFSGESDGENHYSNLVNTSSKPLVATAIRYPEDSFDSTKGRSATKAPSQKTTPPQPKKPTPPAPNNQSQDYNKARRQATTPTQEEYQQLLRLGYTGSYSQYAYDKQHSNFPSPAEYMYNRQQGRPNYQNFGPVEVANYQNGETSYRVSHVAVSGTPKVESVVSSEYNCGGHSTALDYITQAEIAKFQQQQYEGEAIIGALSGAINSFGRNIIDALAGLSRLVRPSKTYNIDTRSKKGKESLETYTKGLAHNGIYNAYGIADTYYAVGQLLGDVASTVAEYVGLLKAAKGITSALKKAPELLSKLSGLGGMLLPASGPPIETAASVAGTITEAGELSEALALFGDILFNYSAFKNDWDTLQEEINSAENSSGNKTLSESDIKEILDEAVHNEESNTAILGQTGSYDVIGERKNYKYFQTTDEKWNELKKATGENYDELWKINKEFIDEIIEEGDEILISDDPTKEYLFQNGAKRFFQRELDYLRELGYTFEQLENNLWRVVR